MSEQERVVLRLEDNLELLATAEPASEAEPKVGFHFEVNFADGDFSLDLENVSEPGGPIDYSRLRTALDRVLQRVDAQLGRGGSEGTVDGPDAQQPS